MTVAARSAHLVVGAVLLAAVAAALSGFASSSAADPQSRGEEVVGADRPHETLGDLWLPPLRRPIGEPARPPVFGRNGYYSVQVNVDEFGNNIPGDAGNEPSIAVDPTNPNHMAIGWRQFDTIDSNFRQAGVGYSRDAGHSWTFPGVLEPGVFRSDPVLAADAGGTFYYYSLTLAPEYICDVFKSSDGGINWVGPTAAYGGDKAWIAIDRTDGIGRGNLYAAWGYSDAWWSGYRFTRSTDGGETFDVPVLTPELPGRFVITVAPDGAVYVAGYRVVFVVVKSSTVQDPSAPLDFDFAVEVDLGGTFRSRAGPNPGGLLGQVWVAADHSGGPTHGNVYVLCSVDPPGNDPLDVHFIRSTDGGLTWSAPVRVNDDPLGTNAWQWFGTLSVAPNGRIDVIWNDTRNSGLDNVCEVFYSYSTDAGETWSENAVISPPFDSWLGWPSQNKLGDYYDMVSDEVGANLAYAATFNGEQDVYFMRIGDFDCNGNGVGDGDDIAGGASQDDNNNGIPDECECPGDLDGDADVDQTDLAMLLADWGCIGGDCPGDVDADGDVDQADLGLLLAHWGCDK